MVTEKPLAEIIDLSSKALDYLDDLFDQTQPSAEKPDLSIEPECPKESLPKVVEEQK